MTTDAKQFATNAHHGQVRKYTGEPYIVHPEAVARLVSSVTDDPETIAAAWLHDVVEDTPVSLREIQVRFGSTVATLVDWVTNKFTCGEREVRKALERIRLRNADLRAKTIKLADMLDNVPSMVEHDPDFAKVYVQEKRLLLDCLRGGNEELWHQAQIMLYHCYHQLGLNDDHA